MDSLPVKKIKSEPLDYTNVSIRSSQIKQEMNCSVSVKTEPTASFFSNNSVTAVKNFKQKCVKTRKKYKSKKRVGAKGQKPKVKNLRAYKPKFYPLYSGYKEHVPFYKDIKYTALIDSYPFQEVFKLKIGFVNLNQLCDLALSTNISVLKYAEDEFEKLIFSATNTFLPRINDMRLTIYQERYVLLMEYQGAESDKWIKSMVRYTNLRQHFYILEDEPIANGSYSVYLVGTNPYYRFVAEILIVQNGKKRGRKLLAAFANQNPQLDISSWQILNMDETARKASMTKVCVSMNYVAAVQFTEHGHVLEYGTQKVRFVPV